MYSLDILQHLCPKKPQKTAPSFICHIMGFKMSGFLKYKTKTARNLIKESSAVCETAFIGVLLCYFI